MEKQILEVRWKRRNIKEYRIIVTYLNKNVERQLRENRWKKFDLK